jgi:O-antigen/teichoic acid export membrane protein
LYGAKFADAVAPTTFLLVSGGILTVHGAFSAFQIAENRQKTRIVAAAVSTVTSFIAATQLIPKYQLWGAVASVFFSWISGFAVSICDLLYQGKLNRQLGSLVGRLTLAWLVALAFGFAAKLVVTQIWGSILGCLVFFVVFLTLNALLKVWSEEEINIVRRFLRSLRRAPGN